jgi:hypothetical protein
MKRPQSAVTMTTQHNNERVYIHINEFDANKLSHSVGDPQPIKDDKGQQSGTYTRITLEYNYDLSSGQYKDGLFVELPEIQSRGIQSANFNGKTKWSMFCPLQVLKGNKEHVEIRDFLDEVRRNCELILVDAGLSSRRRKLVEEEVGTVIEKPVYWQKKDKKQVPIAGKDPALILNLNTMGKNSTIFKGADGTTIPWNDLKDTNVTLIPMIHVSNIFTNSAGIKSVQVSTVSAVVTNIESTGKMSRQVPTLENMSEETRKTFAEQYNKYKQEVTEQKDKEQNEKEEQTTDAGPPSQGETNAINQLMENEQ